MCLKQEQLPNIFSLLPITFVEALYQAFVASLRLQVFIQRSTGCDHMTCSQCNTHFCYQCGEKFREFKFIGNHYSRLSIFGCKYLYDKEKPVQRKLVRGSIFGE